MTYHNAQKFVDTAPRSSEDPHHERVAYLSSIIDSPHKGLKYIRLAGSNGKTICSALLSSVLAEAGYKVCTLNMTLLGEARENVRINSEPLSIEYFTQVVQKIYAACTIMRQAVSEARLAVQSTEDVSDILHGIPEFLLGDDSSLYPTRAELLLLIALLVYKEQRCDICIIESAHNELDPSLFLKPPTNAVICGAIPNNDRKQINKIKAYIQKGITEVVSAPQDPYAYKIISDTCATVNCRFNVPVRSSLTVKQLSLLGTNFVYGNESYRLGLCGRFQTTNAITVIETLKALRRRGYVIPIEAEKQGLAKVKIKSKFEVISVSPTIIVDSTYKAEAVETVCESLFDFSEITGRHIKLLLPCDPELIKNYIDMLGARGYKITDVYTICSESEAETLSKAIPSGTSLCYFKTPKSAIKSIMPQLSSDDLWLVSGKYAFTSAVHLEIVRALQY